MRSAQKVISIVVVESGISSGRSRLPIHSRGNSREPAHFGFPVIAATWLTFSRYEQVLGLGLSIGPPPPETRSQQPGTAMPEIKQLSGSPTSCVIPASDVSSWLMPHGEHRGCIGHRIKDGTGQKAQQRHRRHAFWSSSGNPSHLLYSWRCSSLVYWFLYRSGLGEWL